jgi:uncharacterized damage-inducible protein DinB
MPKQTHHRLLEELTRKRLQLSEQLQALPSEMLYRRPQPGHWSLMQVAEHMVLAEHEVLQRLPQPSQMTARPRRIWHRLSYLLVYMILRWDIPVPVPAAEMVPDGQMRLAEFRLRSRLHQRWFAYYLHTLGAANELQTVFSHPVAGPLTTAQALRLGILHQDSHHRQIKRIIRKFGRSESVTPI